MARHTDFAVLESEWGIHMPEAQDYLTPAQRKNYVLAMDAQPQLVTTSSSGIPAFLTTMVDPKVIKILLQPNKGAVILGEEKKGTWLDETAIFPVVERVGEVSSYGDWNNNGHAGVNTAWPQRQAYLYQTIVEYGERELERAGLAKLNWVSEQEEAAAVVLNKFQDMTYHLGVQGLQNYGLLNDPALSAAITPSTKAAAGSGTKWVYNGAVTATANEVYTDFQSLFGVLVAQSGGLVDAETPLVLVLPPGAGVGLTAVNNFGVSVMDLIKKEFTKLRIETSTRYATAGGNVVQLIAEEIDGQDTGYCAFNEKLRNHPIIRGLSAFSQKKTQGSWGAIIRSPMAIAQMIGV